MKFAVTLLSFIAFFFSIDAGAQNLTGIWKGHFYMQSFGYVDRYKFEIQIEQLPNNALNGVTYSYKTTVFYGKADLKGLFTKKTKNVVFKETKLMEVKIGDNSSPCLMTCYLEYSKMGSLETLTGTYTSQNLSDKSDCGSGKVYLEKTTETDFYKEEFLIKRENELKRQQLARSKPKPQVKKPGTTKQSTAKTPQKPTTPKPPVAKGVKPGAEENLVKTPLKNSGENVTKLVAPPKKENVVIAPPETPKQVNPKPDVIRKRTNEIAKTITTAEKTVKIDLYDNGEIDGDIVSVYHNDKLIASNKPLTHRPITFNIEIDENTPHNEFVMVAENLGSIPPNTALMVITAGSKRYELFLTSTEKKNAVVVIEYRPEEMGSKK